MKDASYIIIITLFALLLLQRECSRQPQQQPPPDTIITTKIIYDTILITKNIPIPHPVYIIDSFPLPPPIIDTAAIIKDFISLKIYKRTLLNDSTAFIRVTDSVTHNRLLCAGLEYINRRPTIIETTNIIHPPPPQRFQLCVGGFLSFSNTNRQPQLHGAGAVVFTKTKKDHLYGAGYDALNKSIQLNAAWKIKIK